MSRGRLGTRSREQYLPTDLRGCQCVYYIAQCHRREDEGDDDNIENTALGCEGGGGTNRRSRDVQTQRICSLACSL